jgi:hypothetical protein
MPYDMGTHHPHHPVVPPQFVSNLKEQNFKEIAKVGSYAYGYLCADTFKLYYVGVGRTTRRPFEKSHNTIVPSDRRYVVVLKKGLTRAQAAAQEKRYVARYGRIDKGTGILHNRTAGGAGTRDVSPEAIAARNTPEARAKRSVTLKASWSDPEKRAKMSAQIKAVQSNLEVRAKMGAAQKARFSSHEVRAKMSADTKAQFSTPEARANRSANQKTTWSDPNYRAMMSASQRARWNNPEARVLMSTRKAAKGAAELGISVDAYLAMSGSSRSRARKKKRAAACAQNTAIS